MAASRKSTVRFLIHTHPLMYISTPAYICMHTWTHTHLYLCIHPCGCIDVYKYFLEMRKALVGVKS